MKRILLMALLSLSALSLQAQSKTTGSVSLMTGLTAKLDLNNTTTTATLTLTGPSDRWFALQFGSFTNSGGMQSGTDLVYYNGTTLVDASQNGVGAFPSIDASNDWTVSSNTVTGTTRTIVATRSFTGGTGDYTFVYNDANIDFVYARGASASFAIANHGANRGYALNKTFTCIPPAAPTASAQAFCAGATVANLTATGLAGATFNWYTTATGGTALAGTTALNTATYYVAQTLSACESDRTPVTVNITTLGLPTATATQNICTAGTVANLTATGQTGATINWYTAATGGSPLASTTALTNGTYFVGQTLGDCSSTRASVTVTITTVNAPTVTAAQTYCSGTTVANLSATGTGIQWYSTVGGTPLATTAPLTAGNYFATQTVTGCESATAQVTVTLNAASVIPTGDATQEFLAGETIATLDVTTATGATVTWYTLNGTTYTEVPVTTVLTDDTTYFVAQDTNGCESPKFGITANLVLSANSFNLKDVVVYPNPTSGVVTVSGSTQLTGISVINMLGQEVLTQKANDTSVQVNVSQLASGTYILKVTAANGATGSVRVVKQ
ncbi:Ig-like domain-containing protein [Flavobacterium subsaxonicum]|nr:T9SS type A sorting domain-containing protein [Flavobacterium subsaxonicum]